MSKKRLLVFGNSYIDYTFKVKRAPERGESVSSILEHTIYPGGLGVISSLTASRFGTDVIFCSRIGEDDNSKILKDLFVKEGIDARFVVSDRRKGTGVRSITLEDGYKTRSIVYPEANSNLSFDDVESAFMSYPDAVLLNTDLKEDTVLDIAKLANENNTPLILSAVSDGSNIDYSCFNQIEVFCPDRQEVYRITGIDPVDANSALHASVKLSNKLHAKFVVIRLGERGSFVYDGVYSEIVSATPTEVVDTTSVGTVFTSALAHAYLSDYGINKSAFFASAVSSLYISKDGVFSAIPTESELDIFLENAI